MQQADFQFLSDLLRQRSGLALTEDKAYLIESRLMPVARQNNMEDIAQLCASLRQTPEERLLVEVTEAMTTNESSFFRDIKPYEQLRQLIFPMLMQHLSVPKQMRIWSAASSTGQEPYSIAMCILEDSLRMPDWRFEIIATDLAQKVLDKAMTGIYTQFEAQRGLPIQMLVKYFTSRPDTTWQIREHVRAMVQFRLQNLLEDYGSLGRFDLIFCRNVLIYFDDVTRMQITEKMAKALSPHGILMLGATETLVDPAELFMPLPGLRGIYKLK
jgi:chemotaxis protein methyltransferase CheR